MLNVPVRLPLPLWSPTMNATVPLPLPLVPDDILIQPSSLRAVHAHPDPADTVTVPLPPAADTVRLVGLIEYVQTGPPARPPGSP